MIKTAAATSFSSLSSGGSSAADSVGLFDDCAFHVTSRHANFVLGRVQRTRKKCSRGYIDFVRPVSLSYRLEMLFSMFTKIENTGYTMLRTVRI